MGTDSGVGPHGSNLDELTADGRGRHGAVGRARGHDAVGSRAARNGAGIGTLTPGKRADIVVVAGDPFDLANLKANIRAVYADGRLVRGKA